MARRDNDDPTLAALPRDKRILAAVKAEQAIEDLRELVGALRSQTPEMKASRASRMLRNLEGKIRDINRDIARNIP